MTIPSIFSEIEEVGERATCESCTHATNKRSTYLWCGLERSHYPHDRLACKAYDRCADESTRER
jgi:hypothetical protein